VTEHESRLLCAACLQSAAQTATARHGTRALIAPMAALAGFLLSWWIFYIGGEILLEITSRLEQAWLLR
jgi:hypothetical protein